MTELSTYKVECQDCGTEFRIQVTKLAENSVVRRSGTIFYCPCCESTKLHITLEAKHG